MDEVNSLAWDEDRGPTMPGKILVADDDAPVRRVLSRFLSKRGYTVLEAADGEAAVSIFRRERPALVLLDVRMPRKDGVEALREIKAVDPEAPVVMITASLTDEVEKELRAHSASEFLPKPVEMARLQEILERIGR